MGGFMLKVLLAGAAAILFTGSALAADMPVPKAPMMHMPVYNWTGFYVGAGGGYGMMDQDNRPMLTGSPAGQSVSFGGRGYFGTVTAGVDVQFGERFLLGVFGDYDFSNIEGTASTTFPVPLVYTDKQQSAWNVGARIGVLVTPSILTYVNAGYTEAKFKGADMFANIPGPPTPGLFSIAGETYTGVFVGGGTEIMFAPGWFSRTEYRYADYETKDVQLLQSITNLPLPGATIETHKRVQTIRSEILYKFNMGDSIAARY
jgi:outer membrane immunogenic protein